MVLLEAIRVSIFSRIAQTIIPTIVFLCFCQFYLYRGLSKKEKIKGLCLNFCVSYFSSFILERAIEQIIRYFLLKINSGIKYSTFISLFIAFIIVFVIYTNLFIAEVDYRNTVADESISKCFGFFIYSNYVLTIITATSISHNFLQFTFAYLAFCVIARVIFSKDLFKIMQIYPSNKNSKENYCLWAMIIIMTCFFYLPKKVMLSGIVGAGKFFISWYSVLSICLFVFCNVVFKLLFEQAYHEYTLIKTLAVDELTGLMNRRTFIEKGQKIISGINNNSVAVIFVNISNFKAINLNYGKSVGDLILTKLGKALTDTFTDAHVISRLSDDHFAIITPNIDSIELDSIKCRNALMVEQSICDIVLKVGIYVANKKSIDINDALDNSMEASRNAPISKTVSIMYFDNEILEEYKITKYVVDNVDAAIHDGRFKVYYQPIVDPITGMYKSAEALVRWNDNKTGFLPPAKFVPALEQNNLIYKVDCFVFEQICKDHKKLIEMGLKPIPVSFNISRKDFFNIDMVDYVEKMVHKYEVSKELFKIEITESAFCQDDDFLIKQLIRFAELGYKVWMDDFGSGYSSLNLMGTFKFDGIKLDMVFLRNMTPMKKELMRGIVHSAKLLGIEVLSEGVETKEQNDIVIDIGCDLAQGFRYCMPMPLDEHIETSRKKVIDE